MTCSECQGDNAESRKYCEHCGACLLELTVEESLSAEVLPPSTLGKAENGDEYRLKTLLQPTQIRSAITSHNGFKKPNQEDRGRRLYLPYPDRNIEVHAIII